jgi:hypothetical protein
MVMKQIEDHRRFYGKVSYLLLVPFKSTIHSLRRRIPSQRLKRLLIT